MTKLNRKQLRNFINEALNFDSYDLAFKKKYPQAYKAWYRGQPRGDEMDLVDIKVNQDGTMTGWTDEDESGYGSSTKFTWNGKTWEEDYSYDD